MNSRDRELAIEGLTLLREAERVRVATAFAGIDDTQLEREHGKSGKSRREKKTEWDDRLKDIDHAINTISND